ncbi:hypothetical protein LCGC14_1762310 [marine sediment metagenome]|uniref:Uncharacterized protein n=1 Tax=marine sediment metagenome TaxID=412755 RepID=A0A0F9JFP1_9ZZZZ
MTWTTRVASRPIFQWAGTNQHGDRYKIEERKNFRIAKLSSNCNSVPDMQTLILLSYRLDVPVQYDFNDGVAFIEVVSVGAI